MDEMIYYLFLRSRSGLSRFGTLRYMLTGFETDSVPDAAAGSPQWLHLARQQQQQNIFATVYRTRGTIALPFLAGPQPVAIEGAAFFLPSGQPLLTYFNGVSAPVALIFNHANSEQVGGGLLWGQPQTAFGLLGRRAMLPG